jgi:hypothetical protein
MDVKNLGATLTGVAGGVLLGFGLGFQYATGKMVELIPGFTTEVAVGLKPEYDLTGQLIGRGLSMGLKEYIYQNALNPLPLYIIGALAILLGILVAQRQAKTSWP